MADYACAAGNLVKQLADSGSLRGQAGELRAARFSERRRRTPAELFKQNLLTKFQAQQIAAGRAKSLILGNYVLLDKIGAGGMGQVFKAEHRRMERTVAIKMLPPARQGCCGGRTLRARGQSSARLRHPNRRRRRRRRSQRSHFLVMEYVDGQDLSALVKKTGRFLPTRPCTTSCKRPRFGVCARRRRHSSRHQALQPAVGQKGRRQDSGHGPARIESGGDAQTKRNSPAPGP